ncbi:hypothetical protein N0V93_010303 [Gnomoniopsis smithogilvyi]|uniref:Uncharacterized protein n=1 Tax=Gnomoniopsis smithogilvyi TaxID=1191159 RepID=A0A9W8YIP8_9PEZI|nr:hypothetical protein N0V93_010303 [Gnomoniopsis smithogilvyi]
MQKAHSLWQADKSARVFVAVMCKNRYYAHTSAPRPSREVIQRLQNRHQKKQKWPEFPPPLHHIPSIRHPRKPKAPQTDSVDPEQVVVSPARVNTFSQPPCAMLPPFFPAAQSSLVQTQRLDGTYLSDLPVQAGMAQFPPAVAPQFSHAAQPSFARTGDAGQPVPRGLLVGAYQPTEWHGGPPIQTHQPPYGLTDQYFREVQGSFEQPPRFQGMQVDQPCSACPLGSTQPVPQAATSQNMGTPLADAEASDGAGSALDDEAFEMEDGELSINSQCTPTSEDELMRHQIPRSVVTAINSDCFEAEASSLIDESEPDGDEEGDSEALSVEGEVDSDAEVCIRTATVIQSKLYTSRPCQPGC